ncbi:MAG: hypothetical protein ACTS5A_00495 [Candidatus Hodgkinia cicadicola]
MRAADEVAAGCIWTKWLIMKLNVFNIDVSKRRESLLPLLNRNFRRCDHYLKFI